MLTFKVKTYTTETDDEHGFEGLKYFSKRHYVENYEEWQKLINSKTNGTISILSSPPKDAKGIPFIELIIKDNIKEDWCSYFLYNSSIYIMNNSGQTISIING